MIRNWLKTLFRIVRNYEHNNTVLQHEVNVALSRVAALEAILKERTDIHVEAPYFRGQAGTVIVCGYYKNQDYVEVFNTVPQDFTTVVDMLKQMSRYAKTRTVDAPIELQAWIKKELN
jgi:hypothetical protein